MRPVLCMITPHAEGPLPNESLVARARACARAGVHLIQVRQPDRDARPLIALVTSLVEAVAGSSTRVLVNDRVDVAIASGAHGVHLRGDSISAPRVRGMVPPGFLIGRSVHSAEEAARVSASGGLDYLVFGTVFATASKPGARVAGVDALATACAATHLPVLAVGGVTADSIAAVAAAGAAGVAAIRLFADVPIDDFEKTVDSLCETFDTPTPLP